MKDLIENQLLEFSRRIPPLMELLHNFHLTLKRLKIIFNFSLKSKFWKPNTNSFQMGMYGWRPLIYSANFVPFQFWRPNTNFFGVRDLFEDQPLELPSRFHLQMHGLLPQVTFYHIQFWNSNTNSMNCFWMKRHHLNVVKSIVNLLITSTLSLNL